MTQITITHPDVCKQLTAASGSVELVTPDGRSLGTFRPQLSGPISLEEMNRRTARPGGKTTAEVLEHLKNL